MGKGIASGYIPVANTICKNCFHKNVCGDKDYLTENRCADFVDAGHIAALVQAESEDCKICIWKNRHQKCACCKRNRHLKDCFAAHAAKEEQG